MRSATLALVLAVVLVTAGCSGLLGPSRPPSDQRALDAVNRSQEAVADVESYRFALDGHVTATDGDERGALDVTGEGVANVSRQRLNATISADDGSAPAPMHDATRSAYVTGYTAYTECRVGWGRENLTRSTPWVDHTPLGRELALLNRTDVYWRGTETVNGTEAAVVVAYPTKGELQSLADAQGTTDFEDANVKNVTETVWFDTGSWRPLKVRREVRVGGGVFSSSTATATVTLRFANYDRPTTVTRPSFDPNETWHAGCPGE